MRFLSGSQLHHGPDFHSEANLLFGIGQKHLGMLRRSPKNIVTYNATGFTLEGFAGVWR